MTRNEIDSEFDAQTPEGLLLAVLDSANKGSNLEIQKFIKRIARHGISDRLIADINDALEGIELHTHAVLRKTQRGDHVLGLADGYKTLSLPRPDASAAIAAWVIAGLIQAELLNHVRRCKNTECKRYFARGPKAEWCSDNCGAKVRNKEKRDRDRHKGAIT